MTTADPGYLAGLIERTLAEDPRTHELGIRADVRGGSVYLYGEVASPPRLQQVLEVAQGAVPAMTVVSELTVADVRPPDSEEHLS